jgi:hypothetical protein
MKTTIEIADDLADAARHMAQQRGITLRAVIEEGIRLVIREQDSRPGFRLRDASVSGRGLQPEFAERDGHAIFDAAYAGRGGDCG